MDAIDDPIEFAAAASMKVPKNAGSSTRPSVSVSPTRSAPTKAPLIEPMPPMTMTTKARISTGSPMPTCTDWIAPTSAPASPASAAPSAKTSV